MNNNTSKRRQRGKSRDKSRDRRNIEENDARDLDTANTEAEKYHQRRSRHHRARRERDNLPNRNFDKERIEDYLAKQNISLRKVGRRQTQRYDFKGKNLSAKMDGFEIYSDEGSSNESLDLIHERRTVTSPLVIEKPLLKPSDLRGRNRDSKQKDLLRPVSKQRPKRLEPTVMVNDELIYDENADDDVLGNGNDGDDYDDDYDDVIRRLLLSPRQARRNRSHGNGDYLQKSYLLDQQALALDRRNSSRPSSASKKKYHALNGNSRSVIDKRLDDGSTDDSDNDYRLSRRYEKSTRRMKDDYSRKSKLARLQKSMSVDATTRLQPREFDRNENYGETARLILSPRTRRSRKLNERRENMNDEELIRRLMLEREKELILMGMKRKHDVKRYLRNNLKTSDRMHLEKPSSAKGLEKMELMARNEYAYDSGESNPDFDLNSENCDDLGMLDTPSLSPGYDDFCDILYDNDLELMSEPKQTKTDSRKRGNVDEENHDDGFTRQRRNNNSRRGMKPDQGELDNLSLVVKGHLEEGESKVRRSRKEDAIYEAAKEPMQSKGSWYDENQNEVLHQKGRAVIETYIEPERGTLSIVKEDSNEGSEANLNENVKEQSETLQRNKDQAARELFLGIRRQAEEGKSRPTGSESLKQSTRKGTISGSLSFSVRPTNFENEEGEVDGIDEGDGGGCFKNSRQNAWRDKKALSVDYGENSYSEYQRDLINPDDWYRNVIPEAKISIQKTRKYQSISFTCSNIARLKEKAKKVKKSEKNRKKGNEKICKNGKGGKKLKESIVANKMQEQRSDENAAKCVKKISDKNTKDSKRKMAKLKEKVKAKKGGKMRKISEEIEINYKDGMGIHDEKNNGDISDEEQKMMMIGNLLKKRIVDRGNEEQISNKKKEKTEEEVIGEEKKKKTAKTNEHLTKKKKKEKAKKKHQLIEVATREKKKELKTENEEKNEIISDEETKLKLLSNLLKKKKESKEKKSNEEIINVEKNNDKLMTDKKDEKDEVVSDEETKTMLISKLIKKKKEAKENMRGNATNADKITERIDTKINEQKEETEVVSDEETKTKLLSNLIRKKREAKIKNEGKEKGNLEMSKGNIKETNEVISDEENKTKLLSNLIRRKKEARLKKEVQEKEKESLTIKNENRKESSEVISDEENKTKLLSNLIRKKRVAKQQQEVNENEQRKDSISGEQKNRPGISLGLNAAAKGQENEGMRNREGRFVDKQHQHETAKSASRNIEGKGPKMVAKEGKRYRSPREQEKKANKEKNKLNNNKSKAAEKSTNAAKGKEKSESQTKCELRIAKEKNKKAYEQEKGQENIEDLQKKKSLLGPIIRRKMQAKEEKKKQEQLEEERRRVIERLRKPLDFSDDDDDDDDDDDEEDEEDEDSDHDEDDDHDGDAVEDEVDSDSDDSYEDDDDVEYTEEEDEVDDDEDSFEVAEEDSEDEDDDSDEDDDDSDALEDEENAKQKLKDLQATSDSDDDSDDLTSDEEHEKYSEEYSGTDDDSKTESEDEGEDEGEDEVEDEEEDEAEDEEEDEAEDEEEDEEEDEAEDEAEDEEDATDEDDLAALNGTFD